MQLKSMTYSEFEGKPQEWQLEGLTLGPINLLVGKNATGKSRALNVISSLARLLANEGKPGLSSHYDLFFDHEGKKLRYILQFEEMQVLQERFWVDGAIRLDRGEHGIGEIFAEELDGGKTIRFQTPQNELAAVARRDAIQHKFLQPLFDWASSLRQYYFGSDFGKRKFAVFVEKGGLQFDEKDAEAVIALYREAEKQFKEPFKQAVIEDMRKLDYPIEDVGLAPPVSILVSSGPPGELVGLFAKEKDLASITDQFSMSQGMHRALAMLIHMNYSRFSKKATCILIDDIGEGLDFDRSCRLIEVLRAKAQDSAVQLIMSTNDRFVMNKVPLEEWSVLQREGNQVRVRNYENSKAIFDQFKFMGLSNFDFLAYDFINEDKEVIASEVEEEEQVGAKDE